MKRMLYVGSESDADKCKQSFRSRKPISISGMGRYAHSGVDMVDKRIKPYTGTVVSVDDSPTR
jgi:hypothetical protein